MAPEVWSAAPAAYCCCVVVQCDVTHAFREPLSLPAAGCLLSSGLGHHCFPEQACEGPLCHLPQQHPVASLIIVRKRRHRRWGRGVLGCEKMINTREVAELKSLPEALMQTPGPSHFFRRLSSHCHLLSWEPRRCPSQGKAPPRGLRLALEFRIMADKLGWGH